MMRPLWSQKSLFTKANVSSNMLPHHYAQSICNICAAGTRAPGEVLSWQYAISARTADSYQDVGVCAASIPVVGFNAVLTSEHFASFLVFGILHAALAIAYIKAWALVA